MSRTRRTPSSSSFAGLVAVCWLLGPCTASTAPHDVVIGDLVVEVGNLQNIGQGQLVALVYDKVKRVQVEGVPFLRRSVTSVTGESQSITFEALPYGEYAVVVLHDMDKDLQADTNWIGFPNEDLGVSRNAKGGPLGGPRWDAARFSHQTESTQVSIRMWRCRR